MKPSSFAAPAAALKTHPHDAVVRKVVQNLQRDDETRLVVHIPPPLAIRRVAPLHDVPRAAAAAAAAVSGDVHDGSLLRSRSESARGDVSRSREASRRVGIETEERAERNARGAGEVLEKERCAARGRGRMGISV